MQRIQTQGIGTCSITDMWSRCPSKNSGKCGELHLKTSHSILLAVQVAPSCFSYTSVAYRCRQD